MFCFAFLLLADDRARAPGPSTPGAAPGGPNGCTGQPAPLSPGERRHVRAAAC